MLFYVRRSLGQCEESAQVETANGSLGTGEFDHKHNYPDGWDGPKLRPFLPGKIGKRRRIQCIRLVPGGGVEPLARVENK